MYSWNENHRDDVVYSGGFDPLHLDHLDRMYEAKQRVGEGGHLIVIVEPDSFVAKKHPVFMPQEERAQLIRNIRWVDRVYCATDEQTTADILAILRPRAYMIGQDHDPADIPERMVCAEHHIHIAQFEPNDNTPRSSTQMVNALRQASKHYNPPVTVSAIIHNTRGEVLFGVRGPGDGEGMYDLPGGFLERGESLERALCREVTEELGSITAESSRLTYSLNIESSSYFWSTPSQYSDGRDILCIYHEVRLTTGSRLHTSKEITEIEWRKTAPTMMYSEADLRAVELYLSRGGRKC